MFGHGFANALQQQGQPSQLANGTGGVNGSHNVSGPSSVGAGMMGGNGGAGLDLQQLMAMSGMNGVMNNGAAAGNGQPQAQNNGSVPGMPLGPGGGLYGQQQQQQQQQQQAQPGQTSGAGQGQDTSFAAMANMNPALMFNPQVQALLQQQMLQQRQQQQSSPSTHAAQPAGFAQQVQLGQQPNNGQPGLRWPGMAGSMGQPSMSGQQQQPQQHVQHTPNLQQLLAAQQAQQAANGGQINAHSFNPFAQQQHQQSQPQPQQQTQQQNNQSQQGASSMLPNFITPNMLGALQSQMMQNQQSQPQQMAQNQQAQQQGMQGGGGMYMDPAALMAAAAQMSNGTIDANTFLQNPGLLAQLQGLGAGSMNPMTNGSTAMPIQPGQHQNFQQPQAQQHSGGVPPTPGLMQAPTPTAAASAVKAQHQSPQARPSSSSAATPEVKPKARSRTSAKKKKDEEQQQQQAQAQQRHNAPHSSSSSAPQQLFAHAAPSPAPSHYQTPTQSHASIPLASPAQAFAQQQERARSQTRSPSISGGASGTNARAPLGAATSSSTLSSAGPSSAPAGWVPSLTPQQQQQLLQQALSFSKAQSARSGGNQSQPSPSPAQTLMQMGYVYVKANVLPNNGFGAGIPGSGPSGAGAVLSVAEAKTIGVFGPQQQQLLSQGQSQQQHSPQAQPGQSQTQQHPAQRLTGGAQSSPGIPGMQQAQNAAHFMQSHQGVPGVQAAAQGMTGGGAQGTVASQHGMGPQVMSQGGQQQQQQHLQQVGYRSSPLGMAVGSPAPGQIQPSSPATAVNAGSPVVKGANRRRRQSSASSRPASGAGRANHEANVAAASYAPYAQPTQASMPAVGPRSASISGIHPQGNVGAIAPSPVMPTFPPTPSVSLPPVNGGPLPRKTKLGFDIVPEYNARITPLPGADVLSPGGKHRPLADMWKPMSEDEKNDLIEIMRKDNEYTKLINGSTSRTQSQLVRRINALRPAGRLHWWERAADEDQFQFSKDGMYENFKILLPTDKRNQRAAMGVRSALNGSLSSRQLRLDRKAAAKLDEDLVPIRLEIDHEGWKLRDTFTWPAPESYKNDLLERFAVNLCEDLGLPPVHFVQAIRESIVNQVQDHTSAEAIRPVPSKRKREEAMGRGRIDEKGMQWWQTWRTKLEEREENKGSIQELENEGDGPEAAMEDDILIVEANDVNSASIKQPQRDMRIEIKLDITVGAMNLIDQFEWDVNDEGSSAEDFAAMFAADLGLSGEFRTAIAHSIREQVDVYIRSLALVGYAFDGADVLDEELRSVLLAPVSSIVRLDNDVDLHTPKLMQLSELEIMQQEKEREREARRKRRQTRGRRGVNLPDREPLKTARTSAVHGLQQNVNIGIDGLGGASGDLSLGRGADFGSSTRSAATGGMSTRRAAAVMANANIASAAAATASGDFGTPTPQPEEVRVNGAQAAPTQSETVKRRRLDSHATHFEYPGGLGKIDDDDNDNDEDERDRGPKFAPTYSDAVQVEQKAAAELGGVANTGTAAKAARHGLPGMGHGTSSSTHVAWNMARPEEALNQVPNWHDGMWYCSNCGVPGTMDPSRRKGPLGDKSLCGMCGKYFHRHRKARPVEYTRSVLHHLKQLQSRGITPNMVEVEELLARERKSETSRQGEAEEGVKEHLNGETEVAPAKTNEAETNAPSSTSNRATEAAGEGGAPLSRTETAGEMAISTDSMVTDSSFGPNSHVASDSISAPPEHQATSLDTQVHTSEMPAPKKNASQLDERKPGTALAMAEDEKTGASFPTTRGNSPDLPFEQVGSPDDSEESSGDEHGDDASPPGLPPHPPSLPPIAISPSKGPQQLPVSANMHTQPRTTPGRSESPFKSAPNDPAGPATAGGIVGQAAQDSPGAPLAGAAIQPKWLLEASAALRERYPLDRFEVISRRAATPNAVPEWRIRCQDCPGKLYTPGPEETLANFEIHLRNKAHRNNVQRAAQAEQRKPYAS